MAMSCVALVWGICRMVGFFGSYNENILPNKVLIAMHIAAYLFIMIADWIQLYEATKYDIKTYEIWTVCFMVVYFVCILIFGLIVNTIVTKIEIATNLVDDSLMDQTLDQTTSLVSSETTIQIDEV